VLIRPKKAPKRPGAHNPNLQGRRFSGGITMPVKKKAVKKAAPKKKAAKK
jgi:hypothetical protein